MGRRRLPVGLRTIKTAAAVLLAMVVVDQFGATADKLIFAMLGAMSAVEPTFKESWEACLAQIIGVLTGAAAGLLLTALPLGPLMAVGIGIVFIITLYHLFHARSSPSLPCFILVMLCTAGNLSPLAYAAGRIWDTAIGLAIGLVINTLVFPYDNSRQIRSTIESLDQELLLLLEELFDGDDVLPRAEILGERVEAIRRQLRVFSNQRLLLHLRRQRRELEQYQLCQRKARELAAQLAVLCHMERPGRLNADNRRRLAAAGAGIRDPRQLDSVMELDVVTNYLVGQILTLRRELLEALGRQESRRHAGHRRAGK